MLLRGIVATAVVLTAVACQAPGPTSAPTGAPGASSATVPAAAPQVALSGATLTVTDAGGTADYTVGNLRPVPVEAQIIPARGTMYAVDVTIAAKSGTVTYNGFYFVAKASDGSNIPPAVGAVKPGITSGDLGQGRSIEGHVAFDVPSGQSITEVVLRDPKGKAVAVWGGGLSG